MSVELINGDCIVEMGNISPSSVNVVIADVPYGITSCEWDKVIPFVPMWKQLNRVIAPHAGIALFGVEPFSSRLRMSNIKNYKYDWVWDKYISRGFQVAKYRPMSHLENISIFGNDRINYYPIKTNRKKPVYARNRKKPGVESSNDIGKYNNPNRKFVYFKKGPDTLIKGLWEQNKNKSHPTQKPVSLMKYLIETYTKKEELVLDFTMGTGATGVACALLDRSFIGIEKDNKYFEIAKERIERAYEEMGHHKPTD